MLEIKNVTKTFGDLNALDNLSFNVQEGTVFGLVGSNGSGKSTLLRAINGVYKVEKGEILIDGESTFEILTQRISAFSFPTSRTFSTTLL